MVVSDPKKASKAQNGVGHPSAHLVDHDTLDRSDFGIVSAVNRSSFDLIAANKGTRLSRFRDHWFVLLVERRATGAAKNRSRDMVLQAYDSSSQSDFNV